MSSSTLRNLLMGLLALWSVLAFSPPASAEGADQEVQGETELAIQEYHEGDRGKAIRHMMQMAYQGNVAAQFNLGVINYARDDAAIARQESVYWFTQAAEEGDLGAQFNLGMLLLEVPESSSRQQAMQWLQRAAESGHVPAMVNLGILGITGSGTPGGNSAGREWLGQAARTGDSTAIELSVYSGDASPADLLPRMYPIDKELRSEVNRGGSKILVDGAPVHALPTGRQDALVTLPQGATVEVVEKKDGWVKIRSRNGLPAWIGANLVDIRGRQASVNRLEAGLYTQPSSDPGVFRLGSVNKGEQMLVLGRAGEWVQVEAPLRFQGWVRESQVDLRIRTVRSGIGADGGPVASMRSLPASSSEKSSGGDMAAATVITDTPLYVEPGEDSRVIGTVQKGSAITTANSTGRFTRVENAAVVGWIYSSLVQRQNDSVEVRVDRARIRSMPNTDAPIVDLAEANQRFSVEVERNGWFRIQLPEESGWIRTQVVADGVESQASASGASTSTDAADVVAAPKDVVVFSGAERDSQPLGRLIGQSGIAQSDGSENRVRLAAPMPIYGWMYQSLVEYSGEEGVVTKSGARIRLDPETQQLNNIVGLRSEGDKVRVLGEQGQWLRIELPAAQGWVSSADVVGL